MHTPTGPMPEDLTFLRWLLGPDPFEDLRDKNAELRELVEVLERSVEEGNQAKRELEKAKTALQIMEERALRAEAERDQIRSAVEERYPEPAQD